MSDKKIIVSVDGKSITPKALAIFIQYLAMERFFDIQRIAACFPSCGINFPSGGIELGTVHENESVLSKSPNNNKLGLLERLNSLNNSQT